MFIARKSYIKKAYRYPHVVKGRAFGFNGGPLIRNNPPSVVNYIWLSGFTPSRSLHQGLALLPRGRPFHCIYKPRLQIGYSLVA